MKNTLFPSGLEMKEVIMTFTLDWVINLPVLTSEAPCYLRASPDKFIRTS